MTATVVRRGIAAPADRPRSRPAPGRLGRTLVIVGFCSFVGTLVAVLAVRARGAIAHFGVGFLFGRTWNPATEHLGALPFILGTLEVTAIAMALVIPIGLGCALFLVCFVSARWQGVISGAIELLAGIPSVVYGLWALQVAAPWVRSYVEPALRSVIGGTGVVNGPELGIGLLLAGLVLFVMTLPTMVSVTRDVLNAVGNVQLEAALSLGATRWQATTRVILPAAHGGVLGATTLAAGRALGETIAVAMVIGDTPKIAHSLFAPADTMTSVLVNEFTEATEPFHAAALFEVALLLLAISVVVNLVARLMARSIRRHNVWTDLA